MSRAPSSNASGSPLTSSGWFNAVSAARSFVSFSAFDAENEFCKDLLDKLGSTARPVTRGGHR